MSERQRQTINFGNARAIMRIRVTDAGRGDPNQNLGSSNLRHRNVRVLQRFSDLCQSHRSYAGHLSKNAEKQESKLIFPGSCFPERSIFSPKRLARVKMQAAPANL